MTVTTKEICPLCGGPTRLVTEGFPGYRRGTSFSIMECEGCAASYAAPLLVDDEIYGQIYDQIRYVPGYNRYHHYAIEVLRRRDPLTYLSKQEESYWAVSCALKSKRAGFGKLKILEVGCGLGYYTYAVARDGCDVVGVDISQNAISWATKHYGHYYANQSLGDLIKEGERYDFIIMNQLIEHLPDVHQFLAEALQLLAKDGELILTTPNKSAYPGRIWDTDLPPVHLWWFGEEAMNYLAARHKCLVSFVDFATYNDTHFRLKENPVELANRQPILDELGAVILHQEFAADRTLKRLIDRVGLLETLRTIRGALQGQQRWRGSRGPVLAAIMRHSQ